VKLGSLKFTEEHRLTALQNRAHRNILGPKREEVTGEWRKWHNEKLHKLVLQLSDHRRG